MKRNVIVFFICFSCQQLYAQQGVAVNSDGTAPHNSAMLDVKSTNKGILVPRVSLLSPTDATTIPSPANSLLVFNTNTNKAQMPDGEGFYYWDFVLFGISTWKPLSTPPTKVAAFLPLPCKQLANVTTTYQKIADMGTFVKSNTNTFIEITLQTILWVATFNGTSGVAYELRIDDEETLNGNAVTLVRAANTYYPVSITGIFDRLINGTHTVSLWARTVNGSATTAAYDPGCFNNTNVVLIKEYR